MKKTFLLAIAVIIAALTSGCAPSTMIYEGKEQPTTDVEEIIADKLEVENPSLDLEVNISEETED